TAGSINMHNSTSALMDLMGQAVQGSSYTVEIDPDTLIARSLQRDVSFSGSGFLLFPSDNGHLQILAGGHIKGNRTHIGKADAFETDVPPSPEPGLGGTVDL